MGLYEDIRLLGHTRELEKVEAGNSGDCVPIHVRMEPTEACNLTCAFCWWQVEKTRARLSDFKFTGKTRIPLERMLSIMDELADLGTRAVSFTGAGDPLMYPKMDQVLNRAADRGMQFGVTSNLAMPVGDDLAKALVKGVWLRWSLNAGNAQTYARIMNPREKDPLKAYDRAAHNVRRILAEKQKAQSALAFNASYVVCQGNEEDIIDAALHVKNLGLDSIAFRPDTPFERQDEPNPYSQKAARAIQKARELNETDTFFVFGSQIREGDIQKTGDPDLLCFYCNHTMYIDANGDVYPCCFTRYSAQYILGNILDRSISSFWKDEKRKNIYRKILQDDCPPCGYGRINQALKPLYTGKKSARDLAARTPDPDVFI